MDQNNRPGDKPNKQNVPTCPSGLDNQVAAVGLGDALPPRNNNKIPDSPTPEGHNGGQIKPLGNEPVFAELSSEDFIKFLEHRCTTAEQVAYRNGNRKSFLYKFSNLQNLCIQTKTEILNPYTTLSNIHKHGIPWAISDFIYVFLTLIHCWHIMRGYWDNRDVLSGEQMGKIGEQMTAEFGSRFLEWERQTKQMANHLSQIFYNLDVLNAASSGAKVCNKPSQSQGLTKMTKSNSEGTLTNQPPFTKFSASTPTNSSKTTTKDMEPENDNVPKKDSEATSITQRAENNVLNFEKAKEAWANLVLAPAKKKEAIKVVQNKVNDWLINDDFTKKERSPSSAEQHGKNSDSYEIPGGGITETGQHILKKLIKNLKGYMWATNGEDDLDVIKRKLLSQEYLYIDEVVRDLKYSSKIWDKYDLLDNNGWFSQKLNLLLIEHFADHDFDHIKGDLKEPVGSLKRCIYFSDCDQFT